MWVIFYERSLRFGLAWVFSIMVKMHGMRSVRINTKVNYENWTIDILQFFSFNQLYIPSTLYYILYLLYVVSLTRPTSKCTTFTHTFKIRCCSVEFPIFKSKLKIQIHIIQMLCINTILFSEYYLVVFHWDLEENIKFRTNYRRIKKLRFVFDAIIHITKKKSGVLSLLLVFILFVIKQNKRKRQSITT